VMVCVGLAATKCTAMPPCFLPLASIQSRL
jgi:hypothetical protein